MGGVQSLPTTKDTPQVLNFILKEMFMRTDLADIYSLADPERCKRYVIVAADALEGLFLKMRVYPEKGKDGTLYLQSIDGILKSMPADIRAKQRSYCLELAFFFIRIFQIFGALFLSMYDSRLPLADPSDEVAGESIKKGVAFLNPKDFLGYPPKQQSWFGTGGQLTIRDGGGFYIQDESSPNFILNYSLMAPRPENRGPMRFEGGFAITLDQASLYNISNSFQRTLKENATPIIYYTFDRGTNSYTIKASLKIEANNPTYRIFLSDFAAVNDWGVNSSKVIGVKVDSESIVQRVAYEAPTSKGESYPTTLGKPLSAVLKAMFDSAIKKSLGEPPFSVMKYLRKMKYITGESSTTQRITGTNVYVFPNQENESRVKIGYGTKIKVDGKVNPQSIEIRDVYMTITKPVKDTMQIKYKVSLDFGICITKPQEYASFISIPTTVKDLTFTASSEDSTPTSDGRNLTIPDYLERIFREITSSAYSERIKGLTIKRSGLVEPYDSTSIPDELRVKKLWDAMAKDPPVKSHCVARAVQLLSLEAIKGNLSTPAYSSICRLTFGYQKDHSLPVPNQPIINESGIYAMTLLFFDGLENGAPKIMDKAGYKEYLRYLKYIFERYPSIDSISDQQSVPGQPPPPNGIPTSPADVHEKPMRMCEKYGDSRIMLPKDLASNLRSVTNNLYSQQQQHFQKAMTLIFSIFDKKSVEENRVLKFNQRIVSGGMPEINNIANATRALLMDYYKGCELTYRDGLTMIYNYEKSGKELQTVKMSDLKAGVTTGSSTSTLPDSNRNINNVNNNNN